MTPKPQSAALPAEDASALARTSEPGPFVINLCSSTTPMALAQPQSPELKRFTFFMSRRREEGRERFRLHMGYFVTAAEADEWLHVVREIFPGAWVGEAPGKRLRERQAAASAQAAAAAAAASRAALAPPAKPAPVPQLARPAARPVSAPRASVPVATRSVVPARVPTVHPAAPARPIAAKPLAARPAAARSVAARPAPVAPRQVLKARPAQSSNVREVLAQLDSPADSRPAKAPVPPAPAAPRPAAAPASISDAQLMRILEQKRDGNTAEQPNSEAHGAIALLNPDDSGTRRALREAVTENRPVAFAVQLQWSVQPIQLQTVPPLAIFSAYTLYTVEGNREGRKWYGLRLGFFSDALSAKQVAYYVRSEFTTVAVVPVTPQERTHATEEHRKSRLHAKPVAVRAPVTDEFKLIDDEPTRAAAPAAAAKTKPVAKAPAPSKASRPAGRVQARAKARPQTLEETLEILGASELEIDTGRGELINESGVRHLKVEIRKNTAFSRLLDRLSERVTKS